MSLVEISILPVILIGLYIYLKDKHKEPISILIRLFIGGIIACLLTLFISNCLSSFPVFSVDPFKLGYVDLFVNVFIGTALVEEFSKWFILFILTFKSKHFDESYDMIVYAVFLSLGFACLENIFYVFSGGLATGILRAVTAVPGHACFGVLMGCYLRDYKVNKKGLLKSLLVPTLVHGFYDYCIFSANVYLLGVWVIFIVILFVKILKKIRIESDENKKLEEDIKL